MLLLHPVILLSCVFMVLVSKYFLIYLVINIGCLRACFFISTYPWIFQISLCNWFQIPFHFCRRYSVWFQSSKLYWGLFCELTCGLSLRVFHVPLERVWIQLLFGKEFCMSVRCSLIIALFRFISLFFSSCSILYWKWGELSH